MKETVNVSLTRERNGNGRSGCRRQSLDYQDKRASNALGAGRFAHTFNRGEMVGCCLTECLNSLRLRRDPIAFCTWGGTSDCDLPPMSRVSWQDSSHHTQLIDRGDWRWRAMFVMKSCNGFFKRHLCLLETLYI
jgi:hypothetical protein